RTGPTCAATSTGRCWTTSSGRWGTRRGSAWCTWTTPRRSARRRPVTGGCATRCGADSALALGRHERPHLRQRPGGDDVVLGQPGPLSQANPEPQVSEVDGRVRVGVDGELHAVPLGPQDQLVGQVEPVRVAVYLHGGAGTRGGREHLVPVRVDRGAAADL